MQMRALAIVMLVSFWLLVPGRACSSEGRSEVQQVGLLVIQRDADRHDTPASAVRTSQHPIAGQEATGSALGESDQIRLPRGMTRWSDEP